MAYELLTTPVIERAQWKTRLHGPKPGLCYIKFSEVWAERGFKWCGGKFFEITRTALVPYSASYILPADDYKDIDLSNVTGGLYLYPEAEGRVYEILIGIKKGNFHIIPYIPKDRYLLALGHSSMYPDVTHADLKYLGGIKYEDSPDDNPLFKIWAIKDMDAWVFRAYVLDGVDYEKVVVEFKIAKHELKEIAPVEPVTLIRYYEELTGIW